MKVLVVLSLAVSVVPAFADVQKCTAVDGKVVYSDLPCPSATQQAKTIIKGAPAIQSVALPVPEKVVFTGSASTDYVKASAVMDNISILGRDCEWALKVDRSKMQKCVDFMAKLQPGGEYAQVADHISDLNGDRAAAAKSIGELRAINRHMTDIVRYKEFMLANLGVTQR